MDLEPLREQVVVVMGASSGIGRETALRFAGRGAKVVASARGTAQSWGSSPSPLPRSTAPTSSPTPSSAPPNTRPATSRSEVLRRTLILGQRLSPQLVDALLQRGGFEVHYTDEPKTEDAPDNLYASLGYDAVEGSFGGRTHPGSLYTWLELRPTAKGAAVTGATLGALALLRARS